MLNSNLNYNNKKMSESKSPLKNLIGVLSPKRQDHANSSQFKGAMFDSMSRDIYASMHHPNDQKQLLD
jgi:hypothetical protein